ncbi:MAG: hypothetical protein AAGI90_00160 [Chlamydiota bacterium]
MVTAIQQSFSGNHSSEPPTNQTATHRQETNTTIDKIKRGLTTVNINSPQTGLTPYSRNWVALKMQLTKQPKHSSSIGRPLAARVSNTRQNPKITMRANEQEPATTQNNLSSNNTASTNQIDGRFNPQAHRDGSLWTPFIRNGMKSKPQHPPKKFLSNLS